MCSCLCWEAASAHTYMFYYSVKLPVNLLALQTILLPFYIINSCVNHNDESLITSFCTMPWALSILIENNQTKTKHWFNIVICPISPWWRHQMEIFSALLAICAGNSPVPGEFPTQRPVTGSFDVYFDLRPNKWLSKQSWGWWFETLSCSLWRHRNVFAIFCRGFVPLIFAHDRRVALAVNKTHIAHYTFMNSVTH